MTAVKRDRKPEVSAEVERERAARELAALKKFERLLIEARCKVFAPPYRKCDA
jgi:hypothetical protein